MKTKVGNATIFLNTFRKEEEQPVFRGHIDVNGERFDVSLWVNQTANGYPVHMSGQICEPESK